MRNLKFTLRALIIFLFFSFLVLAGRAGAQEKAISASAMGNFCVALLDDHSLWAWGDNSHGQLGDGTKIEKSRPVAIGGGNKWAKVSAGWDHTLALKTDGSLWGWGDNSYGQLGNGTTQSATRPVKIGKDTDWESIEAGEDFSVATKTNGTLWAWGRHDRGPRGKGEIKNIPGSIPGQIGTQNDWQKISVFFSHVLALKKDGTLWRWGNNHYIQAGSSRERGIVIPTQIGSHSEWTDISAGDSHFLVLKADGTLWGVGRNHEGQLGEDKNDIGHIRKSLLQIGNDSDWSGLSGGGFHSLAIKNNGTIWGWGHNREGQVGVSSSIQSITAPTRIGLSSRWELVEAGNDHSLAINTDGELFAWGWNVYGQVGIGKNEADPFILKPVKITFSGK